MEITFFEAKPRGRADAPPSISIRPKGQVTLNKAAVKLLEAEAGDAATLSYDATSKRWLLAYWPDGNASQPQMRAASANSKESLRFQAAAPTVAFFGALPVAERGRSSVACVVEAEPLKDQKYAGIAFYVLTLPAELVASPAAGQKGGNRG